MSVEHQNECGTARNHQEPNPWSLASRVTTTGARNVCTVAVIGTYQDAANETQWPTAASKSKGQEWVGDLAVPHPYSQ